MQAQVLAKYISDYNIKAIKFSPYEEGRLMTCGKDSVRMFRIKVPCLPIDAGRRNFFFSTLSAALLAAAFC